MSKKISCGGFYIDDETLSLSDDNKLSVKGGGSGGDGVLIVHGIMDGDEPMTLDKTWQEIHDADVAFITYAYDQAETATCFLVRQTSHTSGGGDYVVIAGGGTSELEFVTESADGYPVAEDPK